MAGSASVFELSLVQTLDTRTYTNQLHYVQPEADAFPIDLATHIAMFGDVMKDLWELNIGTITANALSLVAIQFREFSLFVNQPTIPPAPPGTVQTIRPFVVHEGTYIGDLPSTGNINSEYLPAFNAFRARKVSAAPGRRGRGHNSFAGVPETFSSGNILTPGDWGTWQINAPLFMNGTLSVSVAGVSYNLLPVVFSPTTGIANNISGALARTGAFRIITVIPNRLVGTMRRRKKKFV